MSESNEMVIARELIMKARAAQEVYATFSQKQFDKAARAAAKTVYDNAELFAREAVEETQMGNFHWKVYKKKNGMRNQWLYTKDKKSKGVIGWEKGKLDVDCILKIAKPAGVVGAITPCPSPVSTLGSNAMQALKGGNAIIICPHPKAKNVCFHAGELIREELTKLGAPADLVQVVKEPSIAMTNAVISLVDVVVATGGPSMVKAAYSSGNPSFGVGQGNCQLLIDTGANEMFDDLAEKTISNRIYDDGLPCTGEQTIIMPESDKDAILDAFERHGAFVINDEKIVDKIRVAIFDYHEETGTYTLAPKYAGMTPTNLGKDIGFKVPEDTKILIFKLTKYGAEEPLCKEKLLSICGYITYSGEWSECVKIAKANLSVEGAGHTSVVWSNNKENQLYAGMEIPVCRLSINNSNVASTGGPYSSTGMVPTGGLGCGFWGGNAISENFNYSFLLNYTRLIYTVEGKPMPSDEEIWSEAN